MVLCGIPKTAIAGTPNLRKGSALSTLIILYAYSWLYDLIQLRIVNVGTQTFIALGAANNVWLHGILRAIPPDDYLHEMFWLRIKQIHHRH